MKYDSMRKIERNRLISTWYEEQPDRKLREIGEIFNLSRQRVLQIVKREEQLRNIQPLSFEVFARCLKEVEEC